MTNRLLKATSPYLLQHAENPVDWWPWSAEALAEAERSDRPILLSVGYAACHWCHVMAHDSFENVEIAAIMNEHFVNIKVDREERPDIDAVYMQATTALTGRGGWPMTCLLAPDGSPFFAGTFFPQEQFRPLLLSAAKAWTERRDEVIDAGQRIVTALAEIATPKQSSGAAVPGISELDAAAAQLAAGFDRQHGGFGGAPKFPPSMALEFLLRRYERTADVEALRLTTATCQAMARGGMYDQLAGGFARYSVDAAWVVPHFEKMLYDNALLLRVYLHWWRVTDSALARRVARETAEFLIRDLSTAEGGFASALDADTDGVEGLTYAWTPAQLAEVLGEDGPRAASLLTVTSQGTFDDGASTLQLKRDPDDAQWWTDVRARLLTARNERPQPARDDKVVTAWNGLAIGALAEAGLLLEAPEFLDAARDAAELMVSTHLVNGRLRRTSRDGAVSDAAGVAEDYGDLADGLLTLHQVTGTQRWLTVAGELLDVAVDHFADSIDKDGGFFDTADDAEQLVQRPRDPADNAAPSGQSAIAMALLSYSALTGSLAHRRAAEQALRVVSWLGVAQPRFLGWALAAAEGLVAGPAQIAIVGAGFVDASNLGADAAELTAYSWKHRPPGAVIVSGEPDADGATLLARRPLVQGQAAAYVCFGMVCDAPVTSVTGLKERLGGSARDAD